jgi:hypothetical protein
MKSLSQTKQEIVYVGFVFFVCFVFFGSRYIKETSFVGEFYFLGSNAIIEIETTLSTIKHLVWTRRLEGSATLFAEADLLHFVSLSGGR